MNSINIPPLIRFPTINNISISVNRSNFAFFAFKVACHANPVVEKNLARSCSYILRHIF